MNNSQVTYEKIVFTVFGNPISKARPRFFRAKGKVFAYTPKDTRKWEQLVASEAQKYTPKKLLDLPIVVKLSFFLSRPKSRPKKYIYPDKRPDIDNLAKAVIDACKGKIFTDDARIVEAHFFKFYGDPPRIEIEFSLKE